MVKNGELYLHFKGGLYKIVDVVTDCETLKSKVIYEQLYEKGEFKKGHRWARDLDDFEGFKDTGVAKIKRFERIGRLVDESENEKVKIKVKRLNKDAILPKYAIEGDAGMDMFSCEDVIIRAGERKLVHTGISMEYPKGYFTSFRDKSGLAFKKGITILGGVFEYTYRGEYMVMALNTGDEDFELKKGNKIVQVLIQPIATADIKEVIELTNSARGAGGIGSTGA